MVQEIGFAASLGALASGDNTIGRVKITDGTTVAAVDAGTTGLKVYNVTGANVMGAVTQSGTWTVQPGNTANTTAWLVTPTPATSGGLTTAMFTGSDGSTALTNSAQAVKASAGQLYGYWFYNPSAAISYVHFYNTAAASVTVGTTNPLFTLSIPTLQSGHVTFPIGVPFSNAGWSVAATTTAGGNSAPATAMDLVVWYI